MNLVMLLDPETSCSNMTVAKICLKSYGERSFCNAAPVLSTNLSIEIKTAISLDVFKSKLKYRLFSSYDEE